MKLFVPEIGNELRLLADWTFLLYNEDRNYTLMEFTNDPRPRSYRGKSDTSLPCTIPVGAILKVDRVYIRKGLKDFSSLSFLWKGAATNPRLEEDQRWDRPSGGYVPAGTFHKVSKKPVRFWAKLDDVNKIECDLL